MAAPRAGLGGGGARRGAPSPGGRQVGGVRRPARAGGDPSSPEASSVRPAESTTTAESGVRSCGTERRGACPPRAGRGARPLEELGSESEPRGARPSP
ncbi:hypothetical protein E2C01_054552 [Portunus trituberculatus]|uniref:Uncharacterized protein n=1 Tax=Portunus trituberculatus TaxID=210409 RepID=A0A5B7GSZ1_PORTR|nr:hypothetical protein [Portunus trituberculatus]